MQKVFLVFLTFTIFFSKTADAQGCSDAGLCSVSSLGNNFWEKQQVTVGTISTIIGLGEQNTFYFTTQVEVTMPTFKNQSVQITMPYHVIIGNLGSLSGIGDLSISLNQKIFSTKNMIFNVVAGGKIPSNDANKTKDGIPLPMAYQTSLGTYDIIFGLSTNYKKWHFSAGYQHPTGNNLNEFVHNENNPKYYNNYNQSYHLQRADDIMMRIEKRFKAKKYNLIFGVLPIYHLWNDKINDGQEIANSSGLTLNLNASASKQLKNNGDIKLIIAAPIIDREVRPDGLTRSFVIIL